MHVRPAHEDDAETIARLDVRSWSAAYRDLMPTEYLSALKPSDRLPMVTAGIERGRLLAAADGKEVLGYALVGSDHDTETGALHMLYVDPTVWRAGVGSLLEVSARQLLCKLGHERATLWVLKGNHRARRFYGRQGWLDDGAERPRTTAASP